MLTVESVLLSIISLLSDPNIESPANIDASVVYRDNRELFKEKAKECSQQSLELVPKDVKINIPKEKSRNVLLSSGNYEYDDYFDDFDEEEYEEYDSDLS